jgi:prepilin-type N-terminal cleavage/methylation domain-containing protein
MKLLAAQAKACGYQWHEFAFAVVLILLLKPVGAGFGLRIIMTKKNNAAHGFSLLEVLIAIFILTFGLFGIAGLYISSFKRTEDAYWRVLATSQLAAMLERKKALDFNCLDWSKECENLLPHGKCQCEAGKVTVCWSGKHKKQCI